MNINENVCRSRTNQIDEIALPCNNIGNTERSQGNGALN